MGKRIVVCCDGTGQQFQQNKSNPLRLHYCLCNDDSQDSFYDPGVGTFDPRGADHDTGWLGDVASFVGETVQGKRLGAGIVRNIQDVYRYLMQVFDAGDRVYLFGFSRGAFTAQAVAGMLDKCGLLGAHNDNLVPYATEIYLNKQNARVAADFKATMARPCRPRLIGVWETVKSLGSRYEEDFFYADTASNCDYGAQALAIDEQREDFAPSVWDAGSDNPRQVWFPGVHSDVGGGYPEDGLANGALRWMIAQASAHGVAFRDERVASFVPDYAGVWHDSYAGGWRLLGAEPRQVPADARIHESAVTRRAEAVDGYAPSNWPTEYVTESTS